ncbi:MAG: selenocysteine-specific translation elongation factor [Planctomycetota bacterium]
MDLDKHFIIGTAGHIDHGKTALVKALTGINTDRLKEEQERGMTIDLGYAYLDIAGTRVGVVDVPGHEKFVKNMLAGATGIDLALLVVAADDGVMPQTTEHLEILDLLGVKPGLVVITKIDLVDDDIRKLVRQEVENLLLDTCLAGSPMVEVSSVTGEGIDTLKDTVAALVATIQSRRPLTLPFRMPIDRVFSQQGFGCVVTGSVAAGTIEQGAMLEIIPGSIEARLRGIQVHGQEMPTATAGQRTALNLSGVKAEQISRGLVLSVPGHLVETELVDARLRFLKTAVHPLKHNDRIRFHAGTIEAIARVSILEGNQIKPGQTGFVQFKLETPVAVQRDDRYVIRSYSPMQTIGGGIILRRRAERLKRNRAGVIAALEQLCSDAPEAVIQQTILDAKPFSLTSDAVAHIAEIPAEQVEQITHKLSGVGSIVIERGGVMAHAAQLTETKDRILRALREFHEHNRLAVGMVPAQLMSRARVEMPLEAFTGIIGKMTAQGDVKIVGSLIAASDFGPRLSPEEKSAAAKIQTILRSAGSSPPLIQDVLTETDLGTSRAVPVLEGLIHSCQVVRLTEQICYDASVMLEIKKKVTDFLRAHGEIQVGDLKGLIGVSRKFAIPILEHLDKIGLTERVGDKRRLKS